MRTVRLKYIIRPREITNRANLQVLSVYRDYGVVPKDSRSGNFNKTPDDITRYQEVRIGDLAINKMKAWQGSLGVSAYHGIVSPDYLVCTIDSSIDSRFLHYLLRSSPLVAQFGIRSKGIRPAQWRIYWDDLADISVTLPRSEEQRRIADFLDSAIDRINEASALIIRQTRLLDERHQATIDTEINRGHDLIPLKYAATITDTEHKTAPLVHGGGYWVAGTAAVRDGLINHSALYETDHASFQEWTRRRRPRHGDVLLSREAPVGEVGLYRSEDPPVAIGQRMVLIAPECKRITSEYLVWSLLSSRTRRFLDDVTQGSLHPHLNMSDIGLIRVNAISLPEQEIVVRRLSRIANEFRYLNELRSSQLSFLKERRRAVITAAVAGQIDVTTARGVVT